jgi:Fur family ferric uptake transcriptional regulator
MELEPYKKLFRRRGYKMTPQRELVISSFLELDKHVSVDELYQRVRGKDANVGYSTVWRNLKLICQVGLAEEVNIGDGVTRYDRVTEAPHGHFYCSGCKEFVEIDVDDIISALESRARRMGFHPDGFKIEVQGLCRDCAGQGEPKPKTGPATERRTTRVRRRKLAEESS